MSSHAIIIFFACVHWVVWMKVCKSWSFLMRSWASCGMLPTPPNLMPKTCKSESKASQTKKGFRISYFFFASEGRWSHSTWDLTWAWATIFDHFVIELHVHGLRWTHSFEYGLSNATPFTSWKITEFVFSTMRSYIFLRYWANNSLVAYAMEHVLTFHTHFNPTLIQQGKQH